MVHLQQIANQLPYAYTNTVKAIKSYILNANKPVQVIVPIEQSSVKAVNKLSATSQKHNRPLGFKNSALQNRRMKNQDLVKNNARFTNVPTLSESLVLEDLMFLEESQVLKETVTPKEV